MRYGSELGGWCTKGVPSPYGVSLRKSIRHEWLTFSWIIQFEVDDDTRVKFWMTCGAVIVRLKRTSQSYIELVCDKESSRAEVMHFPNGMLHLDF